ncbi:hypothetical protein SAMN04487900_11376 [Prevotella communis]|uniref:Uncharacterized protein n=1 Tax=Prevotella communis TaxID=2913614 RepID=A0A1H0I853_9BACT|nr:hypothetical protein SAMN04487900_11376 [Prevotella communis]
MTKTIKTLPQYVPDFQSRKLRGSYFSLNASI